MNINMGTLFSHVTFVRHIKKDKYCSKNEPMSGEMELM